MGSTAATDGNAFLGSLCSREQELRNVNGSPGRKPGAGRVSALTARSALWEGVLASPRTSPAGRIGFSPDAGRRIPPATGSESGVWGVAGGERTVSGAAARRRRDRVGAELQPTPTTGADQLRSSRTEALLDRLDVRQAVDLVCGGGSRSGGWADARNGRAAAAGPERRETRTGRRAAGSDRRERPRRRAARGDRPRSGAEAFAVAVAVGCGRRGAVAVQDPALCERNGEVVHTRESQAVYSDSGGAVR